MPPLHPLLVHFAVVFVILAALGQIGAVLVPPRTPLARLGATRILSRDIAHGAADRPRRR